MSADRERIEYTKGEPFTKSLGGEYELEITPFESKKYSGKRHALLLRNGSPVAAFLRNYSDFPYALVTHPNGNEYFVCSEDYHGQVTIYNLTTGKRRSIHPMDGKDRPRLGAYFMWIRIEWESEEQVLNAYGGYWGMESEFGTRTFDFKDPERVPYDDEWWKGIRSTEGEERFEDDEDGDE